MEASREFSRTPRRLPPCSDVSVLQKTRMSHFSETHHRIDKGTSHALKPPGKTSSKSRNCSTGLQTLSERGCGACDYDEKKWYLLSEMSGSCASSCARREAFRPTSISGTLAVSQTFIWGACMQQLAQWLQAPKTKLDRFVEIVSVPYRRFTCCAVHQPFKSALF